MDNEKLDKKHAPKCLDDVVGQGEVIFALRAWLDAPYPVAFLLHGPTGTGKSTVARLIASEFGLDKHSPDYFEVASGQQDGDAVERIVDAFRFQPWGGGWRVVVVEECDAMTPKAANLWLSALDSANLPARTVLVFTTNFVHKLPDRFRHRTEPLEFKGDARALRQDAQALIDTVWRKEIGGSADPPGSTTSPAWSTGMDC